MLRGELVGHFVAVCALLAAGDAGHRVDLSRNGHVSKSRFDRRQGYRNLGKYIGTTNCLFSQCRI